jgi:hypothetical protein
MGIRQQETAPQTVPQTALEAVRNAVLKPVWASYVFRKWTEDVEAAALQAAAWACWPV